MSEEFNIEKVLPFLFCAQCGCNFDADDAKLLVTGNDTVIVKVTCKGCGKKYALAFMDLTFPMFAQSYGGEDNFEETEEEFPGADTAFSEEMANNIKDEDYCFEEQYSMGNLGKISAKGHIQEKNLGKITYDEVLEAHDFIQNFEENWRRYLDRRKFNAI